MKRKQPKCENKKNNCHLKVTYISSFSTMESNKGLYLVCVKLYVPWIEIVLSTLQNWNLRLSIKKYVLWLKNLIYEVCFLPTYTIHYQLFVIRTAILIQSNDITTHIHKSILEYFQQIKIIVYGTILVSTPEYSYKIMKSVLSLSILNVHVTQIHKIYTNISALVINHARPNIALTILDIQEF